MSTVRHQNSALSYTITQGNTTDHAIIYSRGDTSIYQLFLQKECQKIVYFIFLFHPTRANSSYTEITVVLHTYHMNSLHTAGIDLLYVQNDPHQRENCSRVDSFREDKDVRCALNPQISWGFFLKIFFKSFFLSDTLTCPILGPLVPLFWISGDISSGFQSQSGFCLIRIVEVNVMCIS